MKSSTNFKNPKFYVKVGLILLGVLVLIWYYNFRAPAMRESSSPAAETTSSAGDESAKRDLKKMEWVKDVYVSPGHMNVGVIRTEKNWTAPMIGQSVCGILRKNGSGLQYVRFVDIEQVAHENKSPNQAEIYKFSCQ